MLRGVMLSSLVLSGLASPAHIPHMLWPAVLRCPVGGGVFPHGEECGKYYVCDEEGELAGVSECPPGEVFSPALGQCDDRDKVGCIDFLQDQNSREIPLYRTVTLGQIFSGLSG